MATLAADLIVRVRGDTSQLKSSMKEAEDSANSLGNFMNRAASQAVGWIAASTIIHGLAAAFDFARSSVIDFNANMEQHNVAMSRMLGSTTEAKAVMDELFRFAAETPFEIEGITETTRNFMALGLEMPQIRPLLQSLADGVAQFGKGEKEIERVRIALVQMANRGKVATQEMNQLNEAGLSGMWQVLADHMHISTAELQKMVEKGLVPADEFFVAFTEHAQSNWAGAAAAQAQTFNGAITTIQDNIRKAIADAFLPLFETMRNGAVQFAEFTKTDEFTNWSLTIQSAVQVIGQALGFLGQIFAVELGFILDVVVSVGRLIYESLQYLNPFATFSPSLVNQVIDGTAIIATTYAGLSRDVTSSLDSAKNSVTEFKDLAGDGIAKAMAKADAETRKTIGYLGSNAVAAYFDAMRAVEQLDEQVNSLERSISSEEETLKSMKRVMDDLKETLDAQKDALKVLEDQYKASEDALKSFLNAPLQGQAAFEEAMFRSEVATKNLELAIINMKVGGALDKAKERVDRLKDSLSDAKDRLDEFSDATLIGSQKYKDAIQKNKEETNKLKLELIKLKQTPPTDLREYVLWEASISSIEDQLDALKLAGDQIELEEQVDLGPQRYELDKILKATKEMTFAEAKTGIEKSRAEVEKYENQLKKAENSLEGQEKKLANMEKQLAKIRVEAQKAELQRWLDTEPQRRELEAMVNTTKELTFEEARQGILDELEKQGKLNLAIIDQKTKIQDTENAIKDQSTAMDEQQTKIDDLSKLYDMAKDSVKEMRDMLKEASAAAKDLEQEAEKAAKAAEKAAKAGGAKKDTSDRKFDMSKLATSGAQLGGPPKAGTFKDPFESQKKAIKDWQDDLDKFKEKVYIFQSDVRMAFLKLKMELEPILFGIKLFLYQVFGNLDFTDTLKKGLDFIVFVFQTNLGVAMSVIKGFSQGFKDTFGPMGAVLNVLGDTVKSVMKEIGDIIKKIAGDNTDMGDVIKKAYESISYIIGFVIGFVITILLGFIVVIAKVIEAVLKFVNFLIDNYPKVKKFFDDLYNAAKWWYDNWQKILEEAWRNFVKIWQDIANDVWNIVKAMWKNITDTFDSIKNAIVKSVTDAGTDVTTKWEEIKKSVTDTVTAIWTNVTKFFTDIYTAIQDKMREIEKNITDTWTAIWKAITDKLTEIKTAIDAFVQDGVDTWNRFSTDVQTAWSTLTTNVKTTIDTWITNVQTAFTGMITTVTGAIWGNEDSFVNKMKNGFDEAKRLVLGVLNDPGGFVASVVDAIKGMIPAVMKFILPGQSDSFYEQMMSGFNQALNAIKALLTGDGDSFKNGMVNAFWTIINAIFNGPLKDIESKLKKPFEDAWRAIRRLLTAIANGKEELKDGGDGGGGDGGGGDGGGGDGKQAGGPVTAGRSYVVGEAGPEIFVPNTSGRIIPNHDLPINGGVSTAAGVMHLTVQLDSRTIADTIMPYVAGEIRVRNAVRAR